MEFETAEGLATVPEMIRQTQQLRSDLAKNVAALRITLEKSKTVATTLQWHYEFPRAAEAPTAETELLKRLTPRELEVLRLIAEGKSTKQAAAILGIAFRTAVCHRYRIFQKLRVHETASLVRMAVRAGLVKA